MINLIRRISKHLPLEKVIFFLSFHPKCINIRKIRCQNKQLFSNELGFGGMPIEYFPPFFFFKIYLKKPETAKELFSKWLYEVFIEKNGWKISKEDGGWRKGSLYIEVKKLMKLKNNKINREMLFKNKEIINAAIKKRINYYFILLESIKKIGFKPFLNPVRVEKENRLYYLINGHHRTAILSNLKYKKALVWQRGVFNNILLRIIQFLS